MFRNSQVVIGLSVLSSIGTYQNSFAETGVSNNKIILGSSLALTGPLGEDGKAISIS
jgi:hypothetical protein